MTAPWVVVAGAAGDIGQAIARRAQAEGYSVYSLDKVAAPRFADRELVVDLARLTGDSIRQIGAQATGLDIRHLIAVVGGALSQELLMEDRARTPIDVARKTFELNVLSIIGLVDALLPIMRQTSGRRSITAISSINALGGYGAPAYSAAKAALNGLVASLAELLATEDIRVNAVALGTTRTANLADLMAAQGRSIESLADVSRFPLGRPLTASEAGDAVFDLATRLHVVTGQTVTADLGQSLRRPR
ncbi:SDR family NAD(P)-dependent oxidoreductase [Klenkia sp. PcliD-1-E]|uniref:SDR family NAD(P)-dependent oxidoreductase n=1 Tax=Klenkia sp. PcliD-1-E TaxID=2954492 RepID=UPI00209794E3|nr:SDR family oxidoreductase [Klenkia sp. PcliD-1-E]MCO7218995.1 SDR family oxidoreductase [Klenkia sp. PcliD-1-E]